MRRSHQNHSFKPFQAPSQRRNNALNHSSPSQSSRTGIIDQRLVEGSQNPQYSSPSPGKPFNGLASSGHHGDVQLDAFDLELLASEDREDAIDEAIQEARLGFPRSTPRQASHQPNTQPPQFSRFFDPLTSITTSRGNGSSSSDPSSGLPSSPLAFFRPKHNPSRIGQSSLETNHDPYPDFTQTSPLESTPHLNSDITGNRQGKLFGNIPPSVRGIVLVSVNDIPEKYRSMFPFPLFNAVQSKSFHAVYNSNDNIVLSAPTGSGKTVLMELAICRLLNVLKDERFKVVYQAPTKSLCSERFRDWHPKFSSLNLKCAELTGDTDHTQLRSVQSSQIIITTPEKWDSMTRKWKDHMKLMQLVKLFLIDEVHILKETRGATLEAVVSRMKNIGSNARFVALSATVPNSEDIATWLGKDATNQHVPAHREHFGEEFRPVTLKKVVYGYPYSMNEFSFDKVCGAKLPEVIGLHSAQKPIMVFCCTRNSSLATAKELARLWTLTNPPARLWKGPQKRLDANNEDLKTTIAAGVAFHHAGLGPADRHTVEIGFRDGQINVICCTSTLAVGVNLPCHLVIIKNTVSWQEGGCKEYSDLEMMQMLGRAGRPQFDDNATAIILTKKDRVGHYERLVQGSESLESCLHLNLIDHLNAEIGLGNVSDVESAVKWLAGTFLFVRLRRNPTHYNLKEGANQEDEDELLRNICEKDISHLRECGLVELDKLSSTQFGEAMARYYVRFETMKVLLGLKEKATLCETLNVISQAEEFHEIRLKANEKNLYREINGDPGIRFPIRVDLALPAHKISLLLQSELGAIEYPDSDQLQKHKFTFNQDKSLVFAHVNRLIRCLIDCQIARRDSIGIRNALELARSFGARVWDHSPLQIKQIEQVGVVTVRKLAAAGITSIEELEYAEAHQIEMVLSKNPPFGAKLLSRLKEFPKLRVGIKMLGKEVNIDSVNVQFKVEVAFMNDKNPAFFQHRPVYVCCLIERSDGQMIDFRRTSASKLQGLLEIELSSEMTNSDQSVLCHVMCDEIAGTSRQAELNPNLPSHVFAAVRDTNLVSQDLVDQPRLSHGFTTINKPKHTEEPRTSISHPRVAERSNSIFKSPRELHDFDGDDLELDDFLATGDCRDKVKHSSRPKVVQLDDSDWLSIATTSPSPPKGVSKAPNPREDDWAAQLGEQVDGEYEPIRLANGKWACNHKCKDKTSCKHFCCREGLDKPPPKPKKRALPGTQKEDGLNQLTISASITKTPAIGSNAGAHERNQRTTEVKNSENFSKTKTSTPQPGKKPLNQVSSVLLEKDKNVPIKKKRPETPKPFSSDYGDDSLDELISPSQLFGKTGSSFARLPSPMTSIQAMNNGADVVPVSTDKKNTDSPELPVFQTNIQVKKSKPSTPKTQPEVIEISDDTPSEATSIENENAKPEPTTPGHDITPEATSIENAEPEPTTPEQSTISLTSPEEPLLKRQASEDEYQDSKRLKRTPFDSHFQAESPKHFKEIALDPEQPDLPVMRTWLDLNADWNDADIDMVKEFKDIIDFI